ncbi:MAG: hypothetical protein LBB98_14310 [Treponema sp.]|nr:hypothetical protein [Treponema sp.]
MELIPANHLVRLVSEVVAEMGIERLLRKYQAGGGASRYHPGDDDQGGCLRIPEERLFIEDAGEGGEGKHQVSVAGRGTGA